jgi:hypothetical protein
MAVDNFPHPTPAALAKDPDLVARKTFCRNYSDCLDRAVRLDWAGFSCQQCAAYEGLAWGEGEFSEEAISCRRLLMVIFLGWDPSMIDHRDMKRLEGELLGVDIAAQILGVPERVVRRLYWQGWLAGERPAGGGLRIFRASIELYRMLHGGAPAEKGKGRRPSGGSSHIARSAEVKSSRPTGACPALL